MIVRRSSIAWLLLGAMLIMSAAIARFVLLPEWSQLPNGFAASQRFEGTMRMINPQAFVTNDLANLLAPDAPVTADRKLSVDATSGNTAIITTDTTVKLPNGVQQKDIHTFAIDRVDFSPAPLTEQQVRSLVPAEVRSTFTPHEGIAFSFAPNPATDGNQMYDTVTMRAQDAQFTKEGTVEGRRVNWYEVNAAGPVKDPTLLALAERLPAQLPKAQLARLLQAGVVPQSSIPAVQAGLASLPEVVAVGLGSTNSIQVAADQQFGTPLNATQTQGIYATVAIDGHDVPVLPLSVMTLHTAPADVSDTAGNLSMNATRLSAVGLWFPILAGTTGLGLIMLAAFRWRRAAEPGYSA